ncbi:phosphatidylserine decarboxylase [Enterococcus moraviensis ATCC BAA-383]|uniref:Phosphatidylserine decarboxylase n=1 Tax=Enterococcus moraviensis ATCC BAA-383 TaxID=1158609 RepID=R2RGT7_9ENTE|nr:phosphatidylserine decarboxylase [Enterococcus moraviensis]EOI06861.1 phosphatidylserine decarboxylase [Enterococcus moraviensis ATCC BAA-383]EOT65204.1 phosphatidylserine decarboxylase [Enterococcus moraviensis ATCC BAA-383]OJG66586.1 phosphatidylserine decarboxylase [Enterococcus moraviensis]
MEKRFKTKAIIENDSQALNFLYKNPLGRFMLKGLIQPPITKIAGAYLNSSMSKRMITGFIKKNQLQMTDYEPMAYTSFNHFFMREIKSSARTLTQNAASLSAPCDGKVTVYPITAEQTFKVKHSEYSVSELLNSTDLAEEWQAGCAVIFRLTPDDYHHYYFIDEGKILDHQKVAGVFHTVQPIAVYNQPVFSRNTREITIIETEKFGKIAQIEVGALMVGKIKNLKQSGECQRFEKKGWFEFGGSTVILLFQKNQVTIDPEIWQNTENNLETIVKFGEVIGQAVEGSHE